MINAIASNVSVKFRPGGQSAPLELVLGSPRATSTEWHPLLNSSKAYYLQGLHMFL